MLRLRGFVSGVRGFQAGERSHECAVEQARDEATQPACKDRSRAAVEGEETDDEPEGPPDQAPSRNPANSRPLRRGSNRVCNV